MPKIYDLEFSCADFFYYWEILLGHEPDITDWEILERHGVEASLLPRHLWPRITHWAIIPEREPPCVPEEFVDDANSGIERWRWAL